MSAKVGLALALLASLAVLLAGLGRLPLIDPDEGRYAWAARDMSRNGLGLTPFFNDEPRFAKPAPLTWLQALSMRAIGETELALRLPGALLALTAVVVVFASAARLGGAWAGLIAALIFATSFRFSVIARQALVDGPLTLALAGALEHLRRLVAGEGTRAREAAVAHAWMAAGALLKGPLAVALPWIAIALYVLGGGRRDVLRGARIGRALAIAGLIAGSYFGAMVAVHGTTYLREVVVRQHYERFRGIRFGQPSERGPGYFPRVLPGDLLPWTPAIAVALVVLARRWRALDGGRRESYRFLLAWVAAVVGFFSLSRFKLPHYMLPAFAPLAVLTGSVLGDEETGRGAGLAALLPAALVIALASFAGAAYLRSLELPAALLAGVGALASLVLAVALWRRPRVRPLAAAVGALTALSYVVLAAVVAPALGARYRPERALAEAVPAGARIGLLGHWSSAFIYYAGRRVETVGSGVDDLPRFAAAGGRAVVLAPDPPPLALAPLLTRRIARGPVLSPRLTDLWRPRAPGALALYDVTP